MKRFVIICTIICLIGITSCQSSQPSSTQTGSRHFQIYVGETFTDEGDYYAGFIPPKTLVFGGTLHQNYNNEHSRTYFIPLDDTTVSYYNGKRHIYLQNVVIQNDGSIINFDRE